MLPSDKRTPLRQLPEHSVSRADSPRGPRVPSLGLDGTNDDKETVVPIGKPVFNELRFGEEATTVKREEVVSPTQ